MITDRNTSERLNAKTLDQMFINLVEHGYDCQMKTAIVTLDAGKEEFNVFFLDYGVILRR